MKTFFSCIAIVALWLALDAPVTKTAALASGASCAARCDAWCAKNAKYKTPAACSAWCQANHCGS
jgi:hypothetical protein